MKQIYTRRKGSLLRGGSTILAAFFTLMLMLPADGLRAQSDTRFRMDFENVPLRRVLDEIEKQSDFIFYYREDVPVNYNVTIKAQNVALPQILEKILTRNHMYSINGRQVALSYDSQGNTDTGNAGTLRDPFETSTVEGRVTDEKGLPVIGASVYIKNTIFGTTSDIKGFYTLRVPRNMLPESKITYSFVGMIPREEPYGHRTTIDVVLREEPLSIDAVVVTGITNIPRQDMVGSYESKKMDDIMKPAATSLDQMLAGEFAGLMVTNSSIRPGKAPEISLRGQSTLLGTTSPLWVIDGVVQSDTPEVDGRFDVNGSTSDLNDYIGSTVSWLSPHDIESVTVLKDASATAIYGSRASNGVIVITTKKGTSDRLSINVSASTSIGERPTYSDYDLMNSKERINFSREAFDAGAYYQKIPLKQEYTYEGLYRMFLDGDISEDDFIRQFNNLETVNTDWLKLMTRTSVTQNYHISVFGGSEKVTYAASASYAKTDATERGNGSERMTARLAVGAELSRKIRMDASIIAGLNTTTGFGFGVSPLSYATTTSRAIPAYNTDGTPVYYQKDDFYKYDNNTKVTGLPYNAVEDRNHTGSESTSPNISVNLNLKYNILPELTYEFVGGIRLDSRKLETWADDESYWVMRGYRGYLKDSDEALSEEHRNAAILPFGGMLTTDDTQTRTYSARNQLTYSKTFNGKHRINALGMWEVSSTNRNSKYNTVWGYDRNRGEKVNDPTPWDKFQPINGATTSYSDYYSTLYGKYHSGAWKSRNYDNNKASLAFIGTYSFDNRYVLNANFRNDWSNQFGQDANHRFNPAFSVGVAWKLASEPFMQGKALWLNLANLRVTYGIQGNELAQTPEALFQRMAVHSQYGETYSSLSSLENRNLKWERTKNWNFGLDLGLFDNRVTLVLDGYTRLSNVGRNMTLQPEYGNFSMTLTGTYIRNSGIEAALRVIALQQKDWTLSIGVNAGRNWNKIVREDEKERVLKTDNVTNYLNGIRDHVVEPGYALGSFWSYAYAGVQNDGRPKFHYLQDAEGNATYVDEDGNTQPILPDGSPNLDYLVYAGNKLHWFTGGMQLNLRYRRFNLNASFSANVGGKDFLANPYSSFGQGRLPDPTANLSRELNDRWKKPGDPEGVPGLYTYPGITELNIRDPRTGNTYSIYDMWAKSDSRVVSKSTLRCQTVQITYNHSGEWLKRFGVQNIAITGAVNNLFLIADKRWEGMDPDMGGLMRSPRSYTFGINLSF